MTVLGYLDYTPILDLAPGPLTISPHGVGTAAGFLAGARLMLPAARARGIDDTHLWRLLTRAIIGALIGARLAYVINHLDTYSDRPLEALRVWEGGASLLGGIVAAILAALPEMRRQRLDFWTVMDAAAPGLALGIAIGRVGDLMVADHLGKQTDFLLGYRCTGADTSSPCTAPIGQAVHQPALYDLVVVLALLGFLLWLRRPFPRHRHPLPRLRRVVRHRPRCPGLLPDRRDPRPVPHRQPMVRARSCHRRHRVAGHGPPAGPPPPRADCRRTVAGA